jgi:hypothetical protein
VSKFGFQQAENVDKHWATTKILFANHGFGGHFDGLPTNSSKWLVEAAASTNLPQPRYIGIGLGWE